MTKTMLWQEWNSGLGECIEAEAQAQAICMQTKDFEARLPRLRREAEACLRRRLTMSARPIWPFFDDGHRALVPQFRALGGPTSCRRLLSAPRTAPDAVYACIERLCARWARRGCCACVPRPAAGGAWTAARQVPARWRSAASAGAPRAGLADFAFAMQGPGQRAGHAVRQRGAAAALAPGRGRIITAFALTEPDAARTWRR